MGIHLRRLTASAVTVIAACFGGVAHAAAPEVKDEGKFFSAATVKKANAIIREIHDRFQKDLVIETYDVIAGLDRDRARKMSKQERESVLSRWLKDRALATRVNGVFVLITRNPPHVEVGAGAETRRNAFTSSHMTSLKRIFLDRLPKDKYKPDEALIAGVEYVRDTLAETMKPRAGAPVSAPARRTAAAPSQPQAPAVVHEPAQAGFNWGGFLCIGLSALLMIWLVVGLVRSFTGGGYAGGGYGPGGFGGGGFFAGLMGGLFGAAIGSWMYDHFFHSSHMTGGFGESTAYGGESAPEPSAASDEGQGFETTGGDYDVADAGGDFGGGDFGGGDLGGGGDFGGSDFGGGDFGGGGDW